MSEKDRRVYYETKADPVKYAAYLERKRREYQRRGKGSRGAVAETGAKRRWRAKHPELALAHRKASHAVWLALCDGRLVRPQRCEECGALGKIEAHHHLGYAPEQRLDVLWLCQRCHSLAHHPRP